MYVVRLCVFNSAVTVTYARGNNVRSQGSTHKMASAAIAQAQWSMVRVIFVICVHVH